MKISTKKFIYKSVSAFLAFALIVSYVPLRKVAKAATPLAITTTSDGTVSYRDLYNQIIAGGYTSPVNGFYVDIYGGSLVTDHLLSMYGDTFNYQLAENTEYTVYPCTNISALVAPGNFQADRDTSNPFTIKRGSTVTPPLTVPPTIALADSFNGVSSITVNSGGTSSSVTTTAQTLTANTQYTLTVTPTAPYAITDLKIGHYAGSVFQVDADQYTVNTDGTRSLKISFTPQNDIAYLVDIATVEPKFNFIAPTHSDGISYTVLIPENSSKADMESRLINSIIGSTVPSGLSPILVEYNASNSSQSWKNLDFSGGTGMHKFGEHEFEQVRFSYGGNTQYPAISSTVKVYPIANPMVSIDIDPQSVIYGDSYNYNVTTNPGGVPYLVIAIDVNTMEIFVDVPASIRNKLGYHYNALSLATKNGVSLSHFSTLINTLADELDALKGTSKDTGVDTNALRKIPGFIAPYAGALDQLTIELSAKPSSPGEYIIWAITADSAYTTAADQSVLEIKSPVDGVYLSFNTLFDDSFLGSYTFLSFKEVSTFNFGGSLMGSSQDLNQYVVATYEKYVGGAWQPSSLDEIKTTEGTYKETISFTGSQYTLSPISRTFEVKPKKAVIKFDDTPYLVTPYSGFPQGLSAGVYDEQGNRLEDAQLVYLSLDTSDGNTEQLTGPPTDIGFYICMAMFAGNSEYPQAETFGTISITKVNATLTIHDYVTEYGDPVDYSKVSYTSQGFLSSDLQAILSSIKCDGDHSEIGTHNMSVTIPSLNSNIYDVNVKVGKHTVVPRRLTIRIDNKVKLVGENDPEFTYSLEGTLLDNDSIGKVILTREEGEAVGSYKITARVENVPEYYSVDVIDGELAIKDSNSPTEDENNGNHTGQGGQWGNITDDTKSPKTSDDSSWAPFFFICISSFAAAIKIYHKKKSLE